MHVLYPAIKPYKEYQLPVDDIHTLYIEELGNPDGIPILFLHGGPAMGCSERDRRFFNPEKYRIILFDQRGCGRSTPYSEIKNNTINNLINDIEKIRTFLSIKKWILFGGSWGATLSLLYGQKYGASIHGMILRGIFFDIQRQINWLFKEGASQFFPESWQEFSNFIPLEERGNLLKAYHCRLFGEDEVARMSAVKHWALWLNNLLALSPHEFIKERLSNPHIIIAQARISCHYLYNKLWLAENAILSSMNMIANIPGIIIHGRYDMLCPLANSFLLKQAWSQAELHIIREAGHSASEAGITDALIRATNSFAEQFSAVN